MRISYHISFHLVHDHAHDDDDLRDRGHDHAHHHGGDDDVKDLELVGAIVRVRGHGCNNFHVDDVYQYLQVSWVLLRSFE